MFFDLTKEIELEPADAKRYGIIRAFLYFLALLIAILLVYLILFPTQIFNYSFVILTANKGNALNPRDAQNNLIRGGDIGAGQNTVFDASPLGKFSKVALTLTLNKTSPEPKNTLISFRKSYKSILLPEGSPFGFKDGTLLKSANDSYIVSGGRLRQFKNDTIISALGFSKDSFQEMTAEDLKYNEAGEMISDSNNYPDSTIFKIEDEYYKLADQTLEKYISAQAYLSEYSDNQAIQKDAAILAKYPLSQNILGYGDGSLIAYGESAFIASKSKIYPIGSPEIFIAQGFDWNDILHVSGDEISLYEKVKMFDFQSAHPDGTVFLTTDSGEYYIIENGQRHRLPTEKIALSYLKKKPILISAKSFDIAGQCEPIKSGDLTYSCEMPLENSNIFPGLYYEFQMKDGNPLKLDNLNVSYKRDLTRENLKISISGMIQKIKSHFGLKPSL